MRYQNIIFDFGNVLGRFDGAYITSKFCKDERMRKEFAGLVMEHWEALDAGMADYEAARQEAIKKAPEDWKEAVNHFFQDWYRYLTPIPQTWELVRELKKTGFKCYILSNAPTYFAEHADYYEIVREFDGVVFSAPVRMAKPDARIYRYLFEHFDLKPETCFFLDDKPANLEAGRAAGMDGIVFTGDVEAVKKEIFAII